MYSGAGVAVRFEIDFYVTEAGREKELALQRLTDYVRRNPND
jgi:hypothetical protein